jgi:hypothetical protein
MGITREMSKILSTSTAITTDAEISAYNYLSQSTASATYLNQTGYQPGLVSVTPTSAVNGTVGATGAVTFSDITSVSLNGVFSSIYDSYKVLVDITNSSTSSDLSFKYRTSGTDLSGTYYGGFTGLNHSGTVVTWAINNSSGAKLSEFNTFNKRATFVDLSLYGPFLTNTKSATWNTQCVHTSTQTGMGGAGGVSYDTSGSSSDGISFIKSSGTMSGTVRIFAYRN